MSRFWQSSGVLWLVLVGLLLQGLSVGTTPGELLLCVGCDDRGWAILAPESGSQVEECCTVEGDRLAVPGGVSILGHKDPGCRCVCVPLGSGPRAPSWLPRLDLGASTVPPAAAMVPAPSPRLTSVAFSSPPGWPLPWGLDPHLRRTVLVL